MNSLKKGEGVPLLNFVGSPGVPLLNFEGGPGVPLLNFRGVLGPTFKLCGVSQDPKVPGPGVLVPLLHHAVTGKLMYIPNWIDNNFEGKTETAASIKDRLQILLLLLSQFKLVNFYSPWYLQISSDFLWFQEEHKLISSLKFV